MAKRMIVRTKLGRRRFLLAGLSAGLGGAASVALPQVSRAQTVSWRIQSAWSAKDTWDAGRTPTAGDRVLINAGHHVTYDVKSTGVIRIVQIAGTLEFARNADTELNVGLIKIQPSNDLCEMGFDCHMEPEPLAADKTRPALLVGTPDAPIPAAHRALIRLHYVDGMDKESCPAIVCCGGRMDFHGAPLSHTWSKLSQRGVKGQDRVWIEDVPEGWQKGDQIIVTSTARREGDRPQTEERRIAAVGEKKAAPPTAASSGSISRTTPP